MSTAVLRRVVITGIGVVSPQGNTPVEFFNNLLAGNSGVSRIKASFVDALETKIAAQADFDGTQYFIKQQLALLDRVSQFALYCAEQAIQDAHLVLSEVEPSRVGCYMGTGMGGASATEDGYDRLFKQKATRLKPFTVLMAMNGAAASQIAMQYHLQGPNLTFTTACSSSAIAIGEAVRQIQHGYCDVMIAGGTEALLTFGTIKAWEALRTLAKEDELNLAHSCKPFSANRTGLVLGEGAAVFVLEELTYAQARGAKIYAEVSGYGTTNDSTHITQPSVDGQARAMQAALNNANLVPHQIGYINAHGTGTQLNDATETAAIKQVFGEHANSLSISSTKSMHGHLMGAAGAVELVATTLALVNNQLPPTINLHEPDPMCDLDYVANQFKNVDNLQHAMSNSFAFGGTSGVLILSKVNNRSAF
ncbi:MAG: beta-ketoacyl-[acyl-carrier-protein] synthase family protein [Methylophilaceae bacterium]|nr:beta-ketoacyl-[acyl-carrier-protein] synthase family protein [Methylophilaceae bacterium]